MSCSTRSQLSRSDSAVLTSHNRNEKQVTENTNVKPSLAEREKRKKSCEIKCQTRLGGETLFVSQLLVSRSEFLLLYYDVRPLSLQSRKFSSVGPEYGALSWKLRVLSSRRKITPSPSAAQNSHYRAPRLANGSMTQNYPFVETNT